MASPRISVLMSVYNGEKYLTEAIQSILEQSFNDFEFIIVDDGSSDNSQQIINSFKDKRINLIINNKNIGLTKSLLKGYEYCQGEFIARMDADDISMPQRFKKQIEYFDKHPEVGVLGTNAYAIGDNSKPKYKIKYPENHSLIKWSLIFSNPICHPSVMIRKNVIEKYGFYNDDLYSKYIEDYNLWSNFVHHTKFANINVALLKLRIVGQKISIKNHQEQINNSVYEAQKNLEFYVNEKINCKNIEGLWTWKFNSNSDAINSLELLIKTYNKFINENVLSEYEVNQIKHDLARRILLIAVTKLFSIKIIIYIFKSLKYDKLGLIRTIYWGIKALVNKYLR